MKFKVTYQVLGPDQLAGRKPYGNEEKQIEFVEADTTDEAIEFAKDSIIDRLSVDQSEPLRLFDDEIDNAKVSADIIVVKILTDEILYGCYNFEAAPAEPVISLYEYAKMYGRDQATVRQKALRGGFQTAKKIGRNWVIDSEEPYSDNRKK